MSSWACTRKKGVIIDLDINLSLQTREKVAAFSQVLHKNHTQIIEEALAQYFEVEEEKLAQNKETNLSFDEFWDGVDV